MGSYQGQPVYFPDNYFKFMRRPQKNMSIGVQTGNLSCPQLGISDDMQKYEYHSPSEKWNITFEGKRCYKYPNLIMQCCEFLNVWEL